VYVCVCVCVCVRERECVWVCACVCVCVRQRERGRVRKKAQVGAYECLIVQSKEDYRTNHSNELAKLQWRCAVKQYCEKNWYYVFESDEEGKSGSREQEMRGEDGKRESGWSADERESKRERKKARRQAQRSQAIKSVCETVCANARHGETSRLATCWFAIDFPRIHPNFSWERKKIISRRRVEVLLQEHMSTFLLSLILVVMIHAHVMPRLRGMLFAEMGFDKCGSSRTRKDCSIGGHPHIKESKIYSRIAWWMVDAAEPVCRRRMYGYISWL